jgi:phage terminase large subunit GpA-like protein
MSNLEVHHKEFRSHCGEDSEQNLITLCSACHATVHQAERFGRSVLPDEGKESCQNGQFSCSNGTASTMSFRDLARWAANTIQAELLISLVWRDPPKFYPGWCLGTLISPAEALSSGK